MAYKIVYKKRFSNKLTTLLQYLENTWGQKITFEFLDRLDRRIATLKKQPFIGKSSGRKPEVRTIFDYKA